MLGFQEKSALPLDLRISRTCTLPIQFPQERLTKYNRSPPKYATRDAPLNLAKKDEEKKICAITQREGLPNQLYLTLPHSLITPCLPALVDWAGQQPGKVCRFLVDSHKGPEIILQGWMANSWRGPRQQ
jgi:hypothetical protein